jgi:large subunit ribosomal protein L25
MITLKVTTRKVGEKKAGEMPAVMYGAHAKSTPIFVNAIEFKKVLKKAGESTVVKLEGDSKENVLIHEIQYSPVKYEPIHADLYVVEKGQKVHVAVPISFVGVSNAVKNLGANLVKILHEVEVEAEATNLPHEIEVDISSMETLSDSVLVKDIKLPLGVEIYGLHADDVVASVVAQVEEDFTEAVAAPDMAAIEVEKKGKKDEEGEVPAE